MMIVILKTLGSKAPTDPSSNLKFRQVLSLPVSESWGETDELLGHTASV